MGCSCIPLCLALIGTRFWIFSRLVDLVWWVLKKEKYCHSRFQSGLLHEMVWFIVSPYDNQPYVLPCLVWAAQGMCYSSVNFHTNTQYHKTLERSKKNYYTRTLHKNDGWTHDKVMEDTKHETFCFKLRNIPRSNLIKYIHHLTTILRGQTIYELKASWGL